MQKSGEYLDSLRYALRAFRNEIFRFRFQYPLEIDPKAGPKEFLHYYLYSDKLSWSIMSMDDAGIPRARIRLAGVVYRPAYIAWWALVQLGHFLRHQDETSRQSFLRQVNWLASHAVVSADGSAVWPNQFDILHGKTFLKAPWVSASDQGLAISALIRGYRLTRRPELLDLARGAAQIFAVDVRQGGLREPLPSGALYSELPGEGVPVILDGFMSSLLGLYDLYVETEDTACGNLYNDGIRGLVTMLPVWNYRNRWSWYGARAYLCPPAYHCLNTLLLEVHARLSGNSILSDYARTWRAEDLSLLRQIEIYTVFLITKNAARIRHKTWRLTQAKVKDLAAGRDCLPATTLLSERLHEPANYK
jgi:hypothetical protein